MGTFGGDSFPVLDVSDWSVVRLEPTGSDEKVWLEAPGSGVAALFKPNRPHDGWEQGEDWPEKVASELAKMLVVPAAHVDLAERHGRRGCLSYDVRPPYWDLQPGAVLLNPLLGFQHDPWDKAARGHTLQNIHEALHGFGPPPEFTGPPDFDAFAVFAGYLVFDALISNRDRHSENWAVLRNPTRAEQCLAPSYDHASALGFNLLDDRRALLFTDPNMMQAFLRKGTAHRFEGGAEVTLVDHARSALDMAGEPARDYWLRRVRNLDVNEVGELVARTARMSDLARNLAVQVLTSNRERLLYDSVG